MRLVKKSVNQDAPDTYHLFYADGVGHAGTDITFFPWPGMAPGKRGSGLTNEVSLAIPSGSGGYWSERLASHGVQATTTTRFGEPTIMFDDVHGLALALVETRDAREFTAWDASPVPAEIQIRGLHAVRLVVRAAEPTVRFLMDGLGFTSAGEEDGWHRYVLDGAGSGRIIDVCVDATAPRGAWGTGAVHHVAWRVQDDAAELAAIDAVRAAGRGTTEVIDRFWFKSVYFREPGGALFEIATDGPGFAIDEPGETLGERLILPPWLEPQREKIESELPPLD